MNIHEMRPLPGSPGCFICDNNDSNRRSLKLKIYWNANDKTVHIPCVPDESWCGYASIVHGGLIASVLDEAMAWVVKQVTGDWAFTAECTLRFKAALEPGNRYEAVASVKDVTARKINALSRFIDENGQTAVQAAAVFLPVKGRAAPRS